MKSVQYSCTYGCAWSSDSNIAVSVGDRKSVSIIYILVSNNVIIRVTFKINFINGVCVKVYVFQIYLHCSKSYTISYATLYLIAQYTFIIYY